MSIQLGVNNIKGGSETTLPNTHTTSRQRRGGSKRAMGKVERGGGITLIAEDQAWQLTGGGSSATDNPPGLQGARMRAQRGFEAGSSGSCKPPRPLLARETQRSAEAPKPSLSLVDPPPSPTAT